MEKYQMKSEAGDRKFLTFNLGDDVYGLEMFRVKEITGVVEIKTVSNTPDCLSGVITLRGRILPLVDLRQKFLKSETERSQATCIIVVEVGMCRPEQYSQDGSAVWNDGAEGCVSAGKSGTSRQIGIIVDRVTDVLNINNRDIEVAPSFEQGIDPDFIIGLGKVEEKIIVLLDIEQVLTSEEFEKVEQLVGN